MSPGTRNRRIILDACNAISSIAPIIVKRARGDWFAVSGRDAAIRIGVTGKSEEEARERFAQLIEQWRRARDAEQLNQTAARAAR